MEFTAAQRSRASSDPIAALRATPLSDADGIFRQGLLALRAGQEDQALPIVTAAAARNPRDPRLAQVRALLAREQGDMTTAVAAYERARALAPSDGLIVHGLARSRLEAGLPAVADFTAARRLLPADGSVIQGLAAAHFAAGDAAAAIALIADILAQVPDWVDGHATLARLRTMTGDADSMGSYTAALARTPRNPGLWAAYLATLVQASRFGDLAPAVAAARAALGDDPLFALYEAVALDEGGDSARAAAAFARLPDPADPAAAVWHVRHRLRTGRVEDAVTLAERMVATPGGRTFWPYLALGWRLLGDPRADWLERQDNLVRTFDLDPAAIDPPALAAHLRGLHLATAQPLDQSVRGGTQTDGPLFSRIDPAIMRVRAAVLDAIRNYVTDLPPVDPRHPHLSWRRDRIRFAGSWSVRLAGGGFHADHVHPQGWISSALYVALPDSDGTAQEGWLTLGGCRALVPDLAPFRTVEPKPGRLVLFPSTMWHGTNPFPAGERLTVAFDVALPAS